MKINQTTWKKNQAIILWAGFMWLLFFLGAEIIKGKKQVKSSEYVKGQSRSLNFQKDNQGQAASSLTTCIFNHCIIHINN